MNRRGFLRNLGFAGAAIAVAPLVSFVPIPKRLIHKVEFPVFSIFYTDGEKDVFGKLITKSKFMYVHTQRATLKELCDRFPNDEIFFYEEVKYENYDTIRACVIKKEPNMEILLEPKYEV
jgi:hypothetical protein